MDRRIGLIAALLLLNGCMCITDREDSSNVPEYFQGCWDRLSGTYEEKNVRDDKHTEKNAW